MSADGPLRTPSSAPPSIGALRMRYGVDWARHERWLVMAPVLAFALAGAAHGWRTALLSASLGLVAGVLAAALRREDRGRVDLHEDGIAIVDARGGTREIRFDDVDLLFVSSNRGLMSTRAIVTTHEGARIVLPGSRYLAPLVDVLVRRCSLPLVAPARAGLANDETLVFGPLTLSRVTLCIDGEAKPWSEIDRVAFGLHEITFYDRRGGAWRELQREAIPHADALAAIVSDLARVERARRD